MNDDNQKSVSSAYQLLERVREETMEDARLDRKARQSSLRLESILHEQAELLREANERAASMERKAEESDQEAKVAKRHAIWANMIALLALAFTVFQYWSSNS